MNKPLENIIVLDLTRVLAGPYATMLLSDLGAEVIKVEIPNKGDDSREFGPFKNDISLYFLSINREKKSISLNLKTEKGKEILKELVKKVDVLVENYRPGTMEKLGLGYEVLKEINPKLIYAASSGFGHTGRDSKKPAYDILAQAMGGIMSITGWENTAPTRVGMSLGDINASLFTAVGIVSALYQRTFTNLGQKIDVAMFDTQVAILENALARYQVNNQNPTPIGNRHPTITPFQAFKAKDDFFVVAVGNDAIWVQFCKAINKEDLINNELFITNKLRTENISKLIPILDEIFLTKTVKEWLLILDEYKVPHAKINKISDLFESEQLKDRNMLVDLEDEHVGNMKIAGNPIKMSSLKETTKRKKAPSIGEHNEEIFAKFLNFDKNELEKLKRDGVI
jgi:CoA:oxalate CoA-transferase